MSVVLQADALEHALMAALPLGPQSAAGGVSLPDSFAGELQVCMPYHLSAKHAACLCKPSVQTCLVLWDGVKSMTILQKCCMRAHSS